MDHQGQAALVNCLTPLTYTEGSCPPPTDIDEGLMHCLSRSIGKHRVRVYSRYHKETANVYIDWVRRRAVQTSDG